MVLVSSSEDGERETTTTTRDSSSSSTLNRLIAIANFLKLHQPLWRAHVVEFFQVVALALTHTLPASSLLSCLHGFCSRKEKKLIHRARMDLFCRKKKEKKRKKLMV